MADEICMIVDFEGFRIDGRFRVREMGLASLTRDLMESVTFDLRRVGPKGKDWNTIAFCTNALHGLSLHPVEGEMPMYYFRLPWLIRYCYDQNRVPGKNVVGYKGGSAERELLESMKIPCMNLEALGCPRMDELPPPEIPDCGWHVVADLHCPLQKTWAYAKWLREL